MGRPSHQPIIFYDSFPYQATSWTRPRRVVAKVEWHAGELFPRVGFVVIAVSLLLQFSYQPVVKVGRTLRKRIFDPAREAEMAESDFCRGLLGLTY